MPENKKFWKFCNQAGNKVELLLYGDISQTSWWGDEVTPKQFAEELAGLGALDEITVRINTHRYSGRGIFCAFTTKNQLRGKGFTGIIIRQKATKQTGGAERARPDTARAKA